MGDLFGREQQILDDALTHLRELKTGASFNFEVFENIIKEYARLLKQQRKVIKISDKTSIVLINNKNSSQEKISQLETELLQNKISIMLSQIQPHFLYNSLTAIQELCYIDPETAGQAVGEFSHYLRGNLDALAVKKTVSFEKELNHTQNYLSLEKKRFGEKLNIVYDICVREFELPVLTLQPIVENAIRHGVTKREEGGTITISTTKTENHYRITVTDDGVGFDSSQTAQDGYAHVGIENVRNRLSAICKGSLKVRSSLGLGTRATITIPKGGLIDS